MTLGVKVMPDGREICLPTQRGREAYRMRRKLAWERDSGICILCAQFVALAIATTEHIIPKGMGGSTHDSRLENLAVSHWHGNAARGSMKIERYLELPLEKRIANCRGPYG